MPQSYLRTGYSCARIAALLIALAGCAESASGPNGAVGGVSCQEVSVPVAGTVSAIPVSAKPDLCLNIPAGKDRYFLAFADSRGLERARTGPVGPADEYFNILVRGVKRVVIPRSQVSPAEAGVPWGSNLRLSFEPNTYLAQYSTCLKSGGGGDFFSGYSTSARYLRLLVENLVAKGVPLETARREVALGALEGVYGIDDANLHFTGLTQRLSTLLGMQFDPATSNLNEAMQYAFDDIAPGSPWNVASTLNGWKYFGYNLSMTASADTAAVKVTAAGDGSGYILIVGDTAARDVRISSPVQMRWLIGRQQQ